MRVVVVEVVKGVVASVSPPIAPALGGCHRRRQHVPVQGGRHGGRHGGFERSSGVCEDSRWQSCPIYVVVVLENAMVEMDSVRVRKSILLLDRLPPTSSNLVISKTTPPTHTTSRFE